MHEIPSFVADVEDRSLIKLVKSEITPNEAAAGQEQATCFLLKNILTSL